MPRRVVRKKKGRGGDLCTSEFRDSERHPSETEPCCKSQILGVQFYADSVGCFVWPTSCTIFHFEYSVRVIIPCLSFKYHSKTPNFVLYEARQVIILYSVGQKRPAENHQLFYRSVSQKMRSSGFFHRTPSVPSKYTGLYGSRM